MEYNIGVEGARRPIAARCAIDPETEIPRAVPVESSCFCGQGLADGVLIDGDVTQDHSSRVEFEGFEVSSTRLREEIRTKQVHIDIDGRSVLRQRHVAKRGDATSSRAMVAS